MSTQKYSIGDRFGHDEQCGDRWRSGSRRPADSVIGDPAACRGGGSGIAAGAGLLFIHCSRHEVGKEPFKLPWDAAPSPYLTGEFARQGAAESDADHFRRQILAMPPQGRPAWRGAALEAPAEIPKISPVGAARRYFEHLVSAWNAHFSEHPLREQMVVLTVPASFDAGARDLTRQAALDAGLPEDLVLLEEPQSALYAWLAHRGRGLARAPERRR